MKTQQLAYLQDAVMDFHNKYGRHSLPWRATTDPYAILVSEVMLQQTQVARVIGYYQRFLEAFPTVEDLAQAPQSDVLRLWSGLGYNRRARYLHQAAREIIVRHGGMFPPDVEALEALPGIGPYTARAIATFAYNQRHTLIETNVRSVFLNFLFPKAAKGSVPDTALLPSIEYSGRQHEPRIWYAALMDFGTHLKETKQNPSRKSALHKKQVAFKGSLREVRGALLKAYLSGVFDEKVQKEKWGSRYEPALQALRAEGLLSFDVVEASVQGAA